MFIRRSGIYVDKSYGGYVDIVLDLTRTVVQWNEDKKDVNFYEDCGDKVLIPRYYPLDVDVVDETNKGEDIKINLLTNPKDSRQERYIEEFKNRRSGIICLEPGCGKTYIAINLVAYFKKKVLIVVHKDRLVEQWREEFLKHTDVSPDDIGRFSSSNMEEAFSKPIILSTIQAFLYSLKNFKEEFVKLVDKSNIGVFIVDECHIGVGPEQFSKVSLNVNSYRTFGLSATPYRSDGNDDIIKYHLGEIVYFNPDNNLLKPKIYMIFMPLGVYKKSKYMFTDDGKFMLSRYYNQVYKSENLKEYFRLISEKLKKTSRNVLILSKNVSLLKSLIELDVFSREDIGLYSPTALNKFGKSFLKKYVDTRDMDELFLKKKYVFSTYNFCREGNNRLDLDTLIMLTPTGNVEQAIGRILRRYDGKCDPVVLDIVDIEGPFVYIKGLGKSYSLFVYMAYKRFKFYKQKGWPVFFRNYKCNFDASSWVAK